MKKTLLAVAFAMVAMVSSAQVIVGGSLGFQSVKSEVTDKVSNVFNFAPEVGYKFNDAIEAGINLGINVAGDTDFSIAPYMRWTFVESGIFSCFLEARVGYSTYGDGGFEVAALPGIALNVTDHVSLIGHVGALGWNNIWHKSDFKIGLDASVASVGIQYEF